jgi:protein O-mannosyl-transferase
MKEWFYNHRQLLISSAIAIITFAVYLPVRNFEFVRYDDDEYVRNNPVVQQGPTWQGIEWAFTTNHAANWHPLTWLSHMLDCRLFGNKPGLHHLVNVLFHIANTLLLFIIFNRMTKRLWPSAFIAALFALHPLHVESVAWVAERKDVLSTLFWLLTMLAYVRYTERPSILRYSFALLFFALGLMAKPMLVTLPFVLLLLDYWPLNRFLNSKFSIHNSFIEKIPFFAFAVLSCIITFLAQQTSGAVSQVDLMPMKIRIANAIFSYFIYIKKMFWPSNLAVLYPYRYEGIPVNEILISAIILILITILVLIYFRWYKYLLVGWFWYLGTLIPVIGLIQVGSQAYADRYTYVPLIGLFIIIAFGATELLRNIPHKKYILAVFAILVLLACAIVTSRQLKYWKNSNTLFDHALAVTNNNPNILNNYANVLAVQGNKEQARQYLAEAVRLIPDSFEMRMNYAKILNELGFNDQAIEQYKIALKIDPASKEAHEKLSALTSK